MKLSKNRLINTLALLALLFGFFGIVAAAFVLSLNIWYSNAVSGVVVNQEGEPLHGVAVAIVWQAHRRGGSTYTFSFAETTTDDSGVFSFPPWGPIFTGTDFPIIYSGQPQIWIAKTGYLPQLNWNADGMAVANRRGFDLSPYIPVKRLSLVRLPQNPGSESIMVLHGLISDASNLSSGTGKCIFALAPKLSTALSSIEEELGMPSPHFYGQPNNICINETEASQ